MQSCGILQYPVYLGLDKLQWYSQVKSYFNCCSSFSADVANQKGQCIGCVNSIIKQFGFTHPTAHTRLLCNITNLPHIKHNVDLLSLLTMQPNYVTRRLRFS